MVPEMAEEHTPSIAEINSALETTSGDFVAAAAMLGMPYQDFAQTITHDEILRSRWARTENPRAFTKALTHEQTLDRDLADQIIPLVEKFDDDTPLTEEELALAKAARHEDARFKKGLEGLNLPPAGLTLALALQDLQGKNFKASVELMGGSMTSSQINMLLVFNRQIKRLEFVQGEIEKLTMDSPKRKEHLDEESKLTRQITTIAEQIRLGYECSMKMAMLLAVVKARKANGGKQPKPGYGKSNGTFNEEAA